MNIAIVNSDGTLKFIEHPVTGNFIFIEGVRYKCVGTVARNGAHIGAFSVAKSQTKLGNCNRCSGTGNYSTLGVCYKCNGSGKN